MKFTNGRTKTGGRPKGGRNKRTIAAASRPDALDHIEKVMATNDGTVTPDVRLRAATVLAMYQHSRPAPSHTEAFVTVDGYEEPKTVEEARALILKLGVRLARGEISVQANDALIMGCAPILGTRQPSRRRSRLVSKHPCALGKAYELREQGYPPRTGARSSRRRRHGGDRRR
jgi:hypothetical protein